MCEHILGVQPASEDEKPRPRTSQADKWALNYTAASSSSNARASPRTPQTHRVETITSGGDDNGGSGKHQEVRQLRLGAWTSNQRSRAATLTEERREQLSAVGMRWT
ncbi:helicase associated domain-containing protein [Streptomyces viridiviolaceus]